MLYHRSLASSIRTSHVRSALGHRGIPCRAPAVRSMPPVHAAAPATGCAVVVFTTAGCPYCKRAKADLTAAGFPYQEVDVADQGLRGALAEATGRRTVPQVTEWQGAGRVNSAMRVFPAYITNIQCLQQVDLRPPHAPSPENRLSPLRRCSLDALLS
jgi:glutaredoxin 3